MMKKALIFLKANWGSVLLSIWCIWAMVKLHRIESNLVTTSDLQDIELTVHQTSTELQEFREEMARERRNQEIAKLFRH
ncbi:hypothetical protein [Geothrix sp. SG200]|uniref:hypothetical protein n=1 Tax=Geothrix sp. SG200 TaxID=2922865 RepID=UPI001FAD0D8F|nr:hypothetical protein [Geothrix sp. SG200]